MEEAYGAMIAREQELKGMGYTMVVMWSHDFEYLVANTKGMKEELGCMDVVDPLDAREGFYGGRTNAIKLHHQCDETERIEYVDVCRSVNLFYYLFI